ncbi:hypothetical protein GOHSU_18_00150 [Gordonia hirsuta DSM 44140 = NBRC 16056]|uniref:Uncharacterized protein n=1 Tax=Gordonia hirsuta DSM 44140 = NBRC 16056 TaxID=1121927 RepID=L7L7X7_9ACTN|nr:hypothetical protein [Gordonia hirsuta]GAC57260.1 hypothetical protein GOHSU_18_00150 [Gordonia hirsuta DSM 44140 = NBRC 16056]
MTATILLAVAVLFAGAGMPVRVLLAGNPERSDADVRRYDLAMTVILGTLLAAAAGAAVAAPGLHGAAAATATVIAVLTAALTGGYFVRAVLTAGGIPTRDENYDDPPAEPFLRGGRVIGVLERTAVAVCLLAAWPAGIAVILGVKGLARFPQLREHHASEQFILGTFASVLWACAAAGIGHVIGSG